jgi:ABC-type uncharacterized transport system YnjBCD ATPase subunit
MTRCSRHAPGCDGTRPARTGNHLDTLVGTRGVKLSGGQGQRAAAARMFVRQPELLVFDDLSSALDIETEAKLWERLFNAAKAAPAWWFRTAARSCAAPTTSSSMLSAPRRPSDSNLTQILKFSPATLKI